jgi:hypothetical protein
VAKNSPSTEFNSKLGSLLREFNLIGTDDMRHAERLAQSTGLPLGKCFVLLDCISQDELQYVLEAQALLREGVATVSQLAEAMESVRRGWTLTDALTMQGLDAHSTRRTRLGELLADAGTIDESPLRSALRIGELCSLPLGKVLVSFNATDEMVVRLALEVQSKIRRGGLERAQAVSELEAFRLAQIRSATSRHFRIGELLNRAGVVTSADIKSAVERAESENRLVGQTLIEQYNVAEEVIATSLCVQNLLDADLIGLEGGSLLISEVASAIRQQGETLGGSDAGPISFLDFLRASGFLNARRLSKLAERLESQSATSAEAAPASGDERTMDRQSKQIILRIAHDNEKLRKALMSTFPEDRQAVNGALIIYELVRTRKLSVNQGLVVFGFRQRDMNLAG